MEEEWFENIREEEVPKIEELKERLKSNDIEVDWTRHNDHTLKRFLRARGGDVDKAYDMFSAHLEWRKEYKVDDILQDGPHDNENIEKLEEYWPGKIHKEDKEGSPVYIEKLGPVDVKGLATSVPKDKLIHYQIYVQEKDMQHAAELSKKAGKQIERVLIIEDLGGVGWSHLYTPAVSLYQEIIKMADANYPETLKRYYVVNPPLIFSAIFKLLSPFVDAKTLAKVVVCSGNKEETTKTLLSVIDAENLPEEYGGTCKCKGGCIPAGGDFEPFKYREDGSPINPINVDVGRRSHHELRVKVRRERSKLSWEFSTKSHDIGFSVHHEDDDKEIVPMERFEADKEPVKGEQLLEKPGTYVLKWDNSYSTLRGKTVTYSVSVEHPEEEKKKKKHHKKKKKHHKKKKEEAGDD